ncbi:hypothetical protein HYPSUDRAFT_39229 [Hypholoma sublateritium FD-334 SS-4]|uniref:Uncharacterized protein n=1 Tax=Hypholoma sublateritium (strain FD-334 SS-4) TaxID=945553 RepID=A0A0D2LA28_HYPSF|nr:hypothetical protein HYPSUDRAFT_39229 [Hypholoma sublateritium FD-334 SS-4]
MRAFRARSGHYRRATQTAPRQCVPSRISARRPKQLQPPPRRRPARTHALAFHAESTCAPRLVVVASR